MTIEDVRQRAEQLQLSVKQNGRGFECYCPAHGDDKTRHLYVSKGDKVQVVFHCKHGCKEPDIVAAFGLKPSDVGVARPIRLSGDWKAYQYFDEAGTLQYESVRGPFKDGKKARFRRPDPTEPGKYLWELGKVRRVPYNLLQLKDAKPGQIVLDVEGEPDVETVVAAGFVGFTNPGGAGGASEKYLDFLPRGVRVAILRDYDLEGRRLCQKKASWYTKRAIPHVVVELRGLVEREKHGDDVSDWINRHGHSYAELRDLVEAAFNSGESAEWDEPLPLGSFEPPPFPVDLLPDWFRAMVEATAVTLAVPVDACAMFGLACLACACQKRVEAIIRPGWREPLSLWILVVLPPANRKSQLFSQLLAPIVVYQRELAGLMESEQAGLETERRIKEQRLKHLENQAVKGKSEFLRDEAERDAVKLAKELQAMDVPAKPQLIVNDATPERLGMLLAENHCRMAVMSPEGDVFEVMAGRYSSGQANLGLYLSGHSGDDYTVDRVNRAQVQLVRTAITFGLTVQPDVLAGFASKPQFRGRGLLGRFLYCVPQSLLGERAARTPPIPAEVAERYDACMRRLLAMTGPHELEFEGDADDEMERLQEWIEPQLGRWGDLHSIADWAGKLAGACARIASLLSLAELAETKEPYAVAVAHAWVIAGRKIGEYLVAHARAAFQVMGADEAVEGARHILEWLKEHPVARFNRRNLHRRLLRTFETVDKLERSLAVLVERGYIRAVMQDRQGKTGPRPQVYDVHPHYAGEGELEG